MTRKFGYTFGESIIGAKGSPRREVKIRQPRWLFLLIILAVSFLIGFARLVDLQLIRGSYFKELAEGNRVRRIPIKAPRGEILDRNGKVLARNIPVYKLARFSEGGVVVEATTISREDALKIQAEKGEANIIIDVGREYPLGPAAAHLAGYVNEVSSDEVGRTPECDSFLDAKYELGDLIGRTGIEVQYECLLRGVNGEELIEVDTRGRLVRRLGRREPVPGKTIKLSVDTELQQKAYEALVKDRDRDGDGEVDSGTVKGAVVIQSPQTGEVLSLVSSPSFDPQKIGEQYQRLVSDKNMPFFNRAVGGAYHPGSTFKIITAASALEEGKIDGNFEYEDKGVIKVNTFSYSNWYFTQYGKKEGTIKLPRAIARSTDTFFYKVGEMAGPDTLANWAGKFGLGIKTGIDLPGEIDGLIPTPAWKEKVKNERWFLGNTYHMSIGQGDLTATPLQINQMAGVMANGGKKCEPHLLKEVEGLQNDQFQMTNDQCEDLKLKSETRNLITEGMIGACAEGGTAFPFFNFTPRVACKTGTAETGRGDATHAWLTAFAPVATDSGQVTSEIAITALVEEGGEGSRVAAPIVKEILDYWFNQR